ncbi:hypothetical protein [Streptomyces sp. MUSC 14]|uniref:hypothetical protein n=1 Tax=Streptomyces sp. MUSC 14 TaxID=1354889 RepID=UPI001160CDA7|nr:hypothetical protein [Streptomyces sp. MUSC 14]
MMLVPHLQLIEKGELVKFSRTIRMATSVLLATAGVFTAATAADAHTARPATPQSFILLDEKSDGPLTVRMWYNTSNGGIHGEGVEPGTNPYPDISVDLWVSGTWDKGSSGTIDVNTSETFANHVKACASDDLGHSVCTGET